MSTEAIEKSLVEDLVAEHHRLLALEPLTEWRELEARFIRAILERRGYNCLEEPRRRITVDQLRCAAAILNLPDIVRVLSFRFRADQLRKFGEAGRVDSAVIEEVVSRHLIGGEGKNLE